MSILLTIFEFLKRNVQLPEVIGILGGSAIPFVLTLYRKHLEKRPSNGPKTITLTSASGESVTIKLGNMTDEENEQILERLRDLAAKANAATPPT
jgi:hypothetical protein